VKKSHAIGFAPPAERWFCPSAGRLPHRLNKFRTENLAVRFQAHCQCLEILDRQQRSKVQLGSFQTGLAQFLRKKLFTGQEEGKYRSQPESHTEISGHWRSLFYWLWLQLLALGIWLCVPLAKSIGQPVASLIARRLTLLLKPMLVKEHCCINSCDSTKAGTWTNAIRYCSTCCWMMTLKACYLLCDWLTLSRTKPSVVPAGKFSG